MKKQFSEEQIIGFPHKTEADIPVKELCRKHGYRKSGGHATMHGSCPAPCTALQ